MVTPSDFARAATWASSSFAYRRSATALVKAACTAATAAVSYNRFVWTSLMPSAFEVASRPAFSRRWTWQEGNAGVLVRLVGEPAAHERQLVTRRELLPRRIVGLGPAVTV